MYATINEGIGGGIMKVLILNGSPRVDGNTSIAVDEIVKTLQEEGVESEVIQIGNKVLSYKTFCTGN